MKALLVSHGDTTGGDMAAWAAFEQIACKECEECAGCRGNEDLDTPCPNDHARCKCSEATL